MIHLLGGVVAMLPWVAGATLWPRVAFVEVLASSVILAAVAGLTLMLGRRWARRTSGGWWVAAAALRGIGFGLAMAAGLVLLIELQTQGVRTCVDNIHQTITPSAAPLTCSWPVHDCIPSGRTPRP